MNRWNYLVILRPTRIEMLTVGPTDAEVAAVDDHFHYCQGLVAEGKMLLAGRTVGALSETIGIAILAAESDAEAEQLVQNDPAIVHGVMTAELQPYRLALFSENPHNSLTTTDKITSVEKEIEAKKKELIELRRALPPVQVKNYELKKPDGSSVPLSELFGDFDEMILIHNMGTGCSYCTLWADGLNSFWPYFRTKCAFVLTSPDDVAKMAQFGASRGWDYPYVSTNGTSLTADFGFYNEKDGYWPGFTTLKKDADGTITRHAQSYFGPGDDYCAIWPMLDLLPNGPGDWEPNYNK
jgi:predicted dithiol-disulfide oxidoreductase (DUF899 family)/uncharacterized protein YciI